MYAIIIDIRINETRGGMGYLNERQEWLDGLKEGDEVTVDGRSIEVVTKRTKTGWIVVGSRTFNVDGTERGARRYITAVTDKLRRDIAISDIIFRVSTSKMLAEKVTLDQAQRILAILKEE